jgi:tRNA(Ile)-lysidine synthase
MPDVVQRIRDSIRRHRMISVRDAVLAAVSGGPDSVFMLHVLAGLQEELGFELKVAHLDHQFRGDESAADAEFVEDLAAKLDLPCFTDREDVPRFLLSNAMSKQAAARMLRYRFLVKTSKLEYCQRIAFGHNADDQSETVLMRILRGAGPDGLAGIPLKRDGIIIRPILNIRRSEIMTYLDERDLDYRTDSSNLGSEYTRNRVRNELIPVLETYNPGISRSLVNLGAMMSGVATHYNHLTDDALLRVVKNTTIGQMSLDPGTFGGYDESLRRSIVRRVVADLRPDLTALPFQHVENVLTLAIRGEVGTAVELPGGVQVRLDHGRIVFLEGDGLPKLPTAELPVPGSVVFQEARLEIRSRIVPREELGATFSSTDDDVAYFDLDELSLPLTVRARRKGDRFRPFGMEGTKTLKGFFIDEKIAWSFRDEVPLICDDTGILWVVGMRRASAAPVTSKTKRVLTIGAYSTEVGTEER